MLSCITFWNIPTLLFTWHSLALSSTITCSERPSLRPLEEVYHINRRLVSSVILHLVRFLQGVYVVDPWTVCVVITIFPIRLLVPWGPFLFLRHYVPIVSSTVLVINKIGA